ncbi:hypothetical protein C8R45DRAFT_209893 [Mycena sanguinolenta]|nr:hypothetical protein C8R45DRAFT_209893 [Mycena sanguinolenta]
MESSAPTPNFITFKFSGTKPTIRDSKVTDPWGQTVLTISSTKKESTLYNMKGQAFASVEWKHSLPHVFHGGTEVKSKDFLPLERKSMIRGMTHAGQTYGWKGASDGMSVGVSHLTPSFVESAQTLQSYTIPRTPRTALPTGTTKTT